MKKIRVLVVDDSVVIRRLLTDILCQDAEIEVAGTAPNGQIALAKLTQINPDLVTMDIEMPIMDGLETLPELRKKFPKLPVIMFSTLCSRGAMATLDALARGATDYVTKPANVGSVTAGMQCVKEQLLPKIKALCPFNTASQAVARLPLPQRLHIERKPRGNRTYDIVAIGSSTGGPQALTAVLKALPGSVPVPIVIVQHMPPVFTKHLADRLHQESALTVVEARGGERIEPGHVYIAPGDYHMELRRDGVAVKTVLTQGPPENSCRPAVDVLFRSVANVYGVGSLGVVLTGMGQDGARGSESIVHTGGSVIAQDEASCVVWGMPRAVTEAGLASQVLPLGSIPNEILRHVSMGRRQLAAC
ncbi:MAG: chemotaxis response regulator protein-glutamate methylesterase [Pirellulales bacterium]|nr:chemotaxis response regulator protein-glutamate methylesterase [Pirellulales bacterium]